MKRRIAVLLLVLMIAAPIGFLVWINLSYWSGLTGHGSGWQIVCSIVDVVLIGGFAAMTLALLVWLANWIIDTLSGP